MKKTILAACLAASALSAAAPALAQAVQRITFARGNDNASATGTIPNRNVYKDYLIRAAKGQKLGVSLSTRSLGCTFNIMPPGSTGEAIYNGSIDGNDATGVELGATGDYRIRVYMLGNGKPAQYTLSVSVM